MESTKKVLLIEDDLHIAKETEERLVMEGYTTLVANDGKQGLDMALENHPDIIILDIMLPTMNGMIILNKLRHDDWGENVPILLFTNKTPDDDMVKGVIDNKPSYYLVKANTSLTELVHKLKEILSVANG